MPANKYLSLVSGIRTEVAAVDASAGVGDAGKIVALNASGVLASTVVNSKTSSAGAGDSGKLPALDAAGKLDATFMPTGVGAETASIVSSENLAAGDLVNLWDNAATVNVRKADASGGNAKKAHGFVLAGVTAPAAATVYFGGSLTGLAGLTGGTNYYLSGTAGGVTSTAPSTAAHIVQDIGVATGTSAISFKPQSATVLA